MSRRSRVVVPRIQPGDHEAEGLVACYVAVPGGMLDLVSGLNGTRVGTADPTRSNELGTLDTFYDGNGDSWGFGSTPLLSTTGPFTIAFESTLDSFADSFPAILQLETSTVNDEFLVFYSNNASYSDIAIGASATWAKGRASLTGIASVTGERHWVVVTYNGSGAGTITNFTMWVNGQPATLSSVASAYGATTDGNAIGDHLGTANGDWHGGIRQVRVYDRVWSEDEAIRFWHPSSRDSLFAPARQKIFLGVAAGGGGGSDTSIAPPSGSATLVGYAPTLISPQSITPDVGTLSIQGYAPSLAQNFSISPDTGALALLGSAPGLIQGFLLTPDTGSLALSGYAPSLGTAGSINPSDGTLTLVGYQPGVTQQSFVVPGAGSLTITGLTPSVAGAGTLIPSEANLTLVGYQPGVTQQTFIVPGVGAISVEAHAPLLVGNTYVVPGVGAATFAGYAPTVGRGTVVSPGTGQILLAGGTPSVIADSGSSIITPASGSMGFVGYAPTVLTAVFVTGNGRVFWLPAQSVEWVLRAQSVEWVLRAQSTEWIVR